MVLLGLASIGLSEEPKSLPLFEAQLADGTQFAGSLIGLEPNWEFHLKSTPERTVTGKELLDLRRSDPLPDYPEGPHIILANGDRLPGKVLSLTGEKLHVQVSSLSADETLPVDSVAILWFRTPDLAGPAEHFRQSLILGQRKSDLIVLRNGDRLEGIISEMSADGQIVLRAGQRDEQIDAARVAVVAFSTSLLRKPAVKGMYAHMVFRDGARISAKSVRQSGNRLLIEMVAGGTLQYPTEELIALTLHHGAATYLSELTPERFGFTPYLGTLEWPFTHNRSVAGNPLRLGGSTFDNGVGVHSASKLVYRLDGRWDRFQALVGLDDQTGREGSVRIGVLVDGTEQPLPWVGDLTAALGPKRVDLKVTGARELTLLVQFGRNGDVQDQVDWVNARLVRNPAR